MAFPETQLTLIQRLVAGGGEVEWRLFLKDYWGPVCRFALRYGAGNMDDAEDVALETFEVLWSNHLLVRWMSNRSAKLRTLLCGVARNLLANRGRVRAGRERLGRQWLEQLDPSSGTTPEQDDVFYAAWAEDLVQQAVESLVAEYYRNNKGDYVRVLYGRLCERLSIAEVARALEIKVTDVVNYYRHTGQRLAENLRQRLRRQIRRYTAAEEAEAEFAREWAQLQEHLARSGGLEKAVQRAYDALDPVRLKEHRGPRLTQALDRMTSLIHRSSAPDCG
jgi:DNA-directed RNA polymerase specialized sigma24 family protein